MKSVRQISFLFIVIFSASALFAQDEINKWAVFEITLKGNNTGNPFIETQLSAEFKHGEILICDAVDPNMTFVVPLAAGVVERRGGMLIHGAIIAREYGLPCVTGVPEALQFIRSGDQVTVDGYLGIVIISPANT